MMLAICKQVELLQNGVVTHSGDSTDFNENGVTSVIATLMLMLTLCGVLELLKFSQCVDVDTLTMKMCLRLFGQHKNKHPIQAHFKI